MPTVTNTLEIPASPEQVWAVVSDPSRYGEWNVTHAGYPDGAPEAYAADATLREQITIMGMPGEAMWKITNYEPPVKVEMEGDGPMGIKLGSKLALEPNGAGTVVSIEVSFDGGPLVGPMGDSVAQAAQKAAGASLQKLSALIA